MKDAAKLLAYLVATVLFGALVAPVVYTAARAPGAPAALAFFAQYDFEKFFHRALLVGALVFIGPLAWSLSIRSWRDLGLQPNKRWRHDLFLGFGVGAVPLVCLACTLLAVGMYTLRPSVAVLPMIERAVGALVVPFLEEPLFRGLVFGILLRAGAPMLAAFTTSAVFSILHFLKAPEETATNVTWSSGFNSIANAFIQFQEPMLVISGFTTLFLLAWVLADARLRTKSLWLPIGLRAGWIFTNAIFNKFAHREYDALPWAGRNLLIGLGPLCVGLVCWGLIRAWLRYVERREA